MKKKAKKRSKNNKKVIIKKIKILSILGVIITIAIFLLINNAGGERQTGAMKVVSQYMSYINEAKYEEMYDMVASTTKKNVSKEDFVERNKTIYEQLEAKDVSVSNMKEEEENRKSKSDIHK